jgi:transglutaminase-like putative cysteine protease
MVRPDASARRVAHNQGRLPVERFFQFSLLGLVASGYLAVAGSAYLDLATILLTGAGILLRALVLSGQIQLELTDRSATLLALAYTAFFPIDYFLLSHTLLSAAVHLVFFLAILKLLSARTNRDNFYIAVIAFLELLAAAILSINFNFFLCLALFLLFAIAALTSGEIRRSMHKSTVIARAGLKRFHLRLGLLGMWVALGILALTGGMFFLLPRTADAALSGLISHRILIPGFSNRVTLGEIGQFQMSSRTVMHVAVYGNQPMGSAKWRGAVLSSFDGKVWSNPPLHYKLLPAIRGHVNLGLRPSLRQRSYRVEWDDLESPVLFFAGAPESIDGLPSDLQADADTGSFRLEGHTPSDFRYDVISVLEDAPETAPLSPIPPVLSMAGKDANLELPPRLDPRIAALAQAMTRGRTTDLERARALEQHLRQDYGYTLELPKREPADPLANFLFVRRKGHCEYFASAMAVMLRTLQIPARMATGFQTGVYNPISDLWLVRASDAHSWVEAWIPGHGWTTFDPTPPDYSLHPMTLFSKAGLYLDAAETFWQQWVVGYDPNHQGTLADRVEQAIRHLGIGWIDSLSVSGSGLAANAKDLARRFGLTVVVELLLVYGIWIMAPPAYRAFQMRRRVARVRRGEASVADATLLYARMLQVVERQGYQKPTWFTPVEFARSLPATSMGRAVQEFTGAYNAVRFGGQVEAAPRMSALLDELEGRS